MNEHDDFRSGSNGGPEDGGVFDESFFSDDLDERFADWVDGRLSAEEVAELEEEMAADDELRRRAMAYRDTVATVRSHLHGEDPPADLISSVMAELPGRPGRRIIPFLASLTAAAAMVILYVVLADVAETPSVTEVPAASSDSLESRSRDESTTGKLAESKRSNYKKSQEGLAAGRPLTSRSLPDLTGMVAGEEQENEKAPGDKSQVKATPPTGAPAAAKTYDPAKTVVAGKDDSLKSPVKRRVPTGGGSTKADKTKAGKAVRQRVARRKPAEDSKNKNADAKLEGLPAAKGKNPRRKANKPADGSPGAPRSSEATSPSAELRRLAKAILEQVEELDRKAETPAKKPAARPTEKSSRKATKTGTRARELNKEAGRKDQSGKRESEEATQPRRERGSRRGGGDSAQFRAIAAEFETPVLLLTVSRLASRIGGLKDRSREEPNDGKSVRRLSGGPTKGLANKGEAEHDEAELGEIKKKSDAEKKEKKKGKRSDEDSYAGRNPPVQKQTDSNRVEDVAKKILADKRRLADSFVSYFERRDALRRTKTSSATVLRIADGADGGLEGRKFKSALSQNNGLGTKANGNDYVYRSGDEVYLVSGDDRQIKQLFLGLKDYLDARRLPGIGGGADGSPAKKVVGGKIPMRVKQLGNAKTRALFESTISKSWIRRTEVGEIRFLLVLRGK